MVHIDKKEKFGLSRKKFKNYENGTLTMKFGQETPL